MALGKKSLSLYVPLWGCYGESAWHKLPRAECMWIVTVCHHGDKRRLESMVLVNALATEKKKKKTYKWANVCFFPCIVLTGSPPPLTEEGGARRL